MNQNSLSPFLSLAGVWTFQLMADPPRAITVPSAWEAHTTNKLGDAAIYTRTFQLTSTFLQGRIFLECDAISFVATIFLNGQFVGEHRGMWSPFQFEITSYVHEGENQIEIRVIKPGGRIPVREALAGFLPDVCTTFGGIWQSLGLRSIAHAAFTDLKIFAQQHTLDVQGKIELLATETRPLRIELAIGSQKQLLELHGASFAAHLEAPQLSPALTELSLSLYAERECIAQLTRRIAFRDLKLTDGTIYLNDSPLHLRGVLDWGWHPERLCPTPSAAELRANFAKAQALGFNLFKLCLFVPDETTFDVADEMGMHLWLEMPLWLPRLTPEAQALTLAEYRAVFQRVHHHPSIVVLSLGCELNAEANAEFLQSLTALAREYFPQVLLCDNSGSAEMYGGVATHFSDFYDYHFYTDPHFFQPLVEHFTRAYQPSRPWLYGEFCDADTLRDFKKLGDAWWLTQATHLERDDFVAMRAAVQRLQVAGITDGAQHLTYLARQQATLLRKYILEQVRRNSARGGYVVTGWADTPITTSGIVDDHFDLKFEPAEWTPFNAERVLTIDRERRRRWVGGDRPAPKDPFCYWAGERVELHVALSNGAAAINNLQLEWQLGEAVGKLPVVNVPSSEVKEMGVINCVLPHVAGVTELSLSIAETSGSTALQNQWKLFVVPRPQFPALELRGSFRHRNLFGSFAQNVNANKNETVILSDTLDEALLADVRQGRQALVWQVNGDERFTRALPFWREAIHVIPNQTVDLRYFSVATDLALDLLKLENLLNTQVESQWRRFDARQLFWSEYVVRAQIGKGSLVISSLKHAGGLGAQANTLETNPLGAWLLSLLLASLNS